MSNRFDDDTMSEDRTKSADSSTDSLFSQKSFYDRVSANQEENSALAEEATTSGALGWPTGQISLPQNSFFVLRKPSM